ncbi:MAG: hypothetical protein CMJ15_03830 [Pelagibacterium sp.]|nr:hypothetical protein [Pelagibacterium sp.]
MDANPAHGIIPGRQVGGLIRDVQDLIDSNPWLQALVLSRVANRKTVSISDRVEDMLLLDTL